MHSVLNLILSYSSAGSPTPGLMPVATLDGIPALESLALTNEKSNDIKVIVNLSDSIDAIAADSVWGSAKKNDSALQISTNQTKINLYGGYGLINGSRQPEIISEIGDWQFQDGSLFYGRREITKAQFIPAGNYYYFFREINLSMTEADMSGLMQHLNIPDSLIGKMAMKSRMSND